MDGQIWLIIGAMALVTAIPRLLPYFIINKRSLQAPVKNWLKLLPIVIFASMIAPPLLTENNTFAPLAHLTDLVAVALAGVIAFFTRNLAFSLGGAVAVLLAAEYLL